MINKYQEDNEWIEEQILYFKRKIRTLTGIRNSDLQNSCLALHHLGYPTSNNGTGLNLSLESNAMKGIVICDTIIVLPTN